MSEPTPPVEPLDQLGWQLENTYADLPGVLFKEVRPSAFQNARLVLLNRPLARQLGLNLEESPEELLAHLFAGQSLPSSSRTIAQAYAGHQFGGFTMLGDGRALLLGEQRSPSGNLYDIQFKGSGVTPFSRQGDGLAALGPMLREYIVSEAMDALGIPTTRSLAVVTTGEPVYRETVLQGAILTRVASSHIRVGTFQFLAAMKDEGHLRALADYSIDRHFPSVAEEPDKYLRLLQSVIDRQAALVAKWQLVGFVHGVMNTDNMTICGETIDYGPCAFLDTYHAATVFSSIDHGGRYAFGNQPAVAQWNLARFSETLLPLLAPDLDHAIELATETLGEFPDRFEEYWLSGMRSKLGLANAMPQDRDLVESLLSWMEANQADYTNTFDDLSSGKTPSSGKYDSPEFRKWLEQWTARLASEGSSLAQVQSRMQATNPAIIPRNHRVEAALEAADAGDLSVLNELIHALGSPFTRDSQTAPFREPPPPGQCYRTFCGT